MLEIVLAVGGVVALIYVAVVLRGVLERELRETNPYHRARGRR